MKQLKLIFTIGLSLLLFTTGVSATATQDRVDVEIDGEMVVFDDEVEALVDEQGRTMVPVRFISEELGAKVEWYPDHESDGLVKIEHANQKIELFIGNQEYQNNGMNEQMDTAPRILEGRTVVPLRFVSEALGAEVNWDGEKKLVSIVTDDDLGDAAEGLEQAKDDRNDKDDKEEQKDKKDDKDDEEKQNPQMKLSISEEKFRADEPVEFELTNTGNTELRPMRVADVEYYDESEDEWQEIYFSINWFQEDEKQEPGETWTFETVMTENYPGWPKSGKYRAEQEFECMDSWQEFTVDLEFETIDPVDEYHPDELPDELTENELKLAEKINEYRESKGLEPFKVSKSLTTVARYHVYDSNQNQPENCKDEDGNEGNLHSWSDEGPWEEVCYTPDHEHAELMWSKPSELTDYKGNGYEISAMRSGGAEPDNVLEGWQNSPPHKDVIVGKGSWKDLEVMGIGIAGQYSHVWFGMEDDPAGYYLEP
ncbi:stalk domain-containing protein [Natranaerobius thermophilus]|uniref:Copper amine oxidase domain protein n=1 Tax=Natranaerobius thermophilus (strain ATCC BAA-1301 / DSM 18059 / JW/NM-WN-LF) TaxID=457570 RepID=B2A0Y1_NATTJ|nr:stalk domain-containing protein [Natranaerobius thermophilus]ACB84604.1 copper amine oxidase domain protein [Natranaerobius thermophilus JW/NM-WN-LF]